MGGWDTFKGSEKCVKHFAGKPEGMGTFEDIVVDRRIILKIML